MKCLDKWRKTKLYLRRGPVRGTGAAGFGPTVALAEVVADARVIANAVSIPAIGDADTGYGPPLTVMRAVREFQRAGLAGTQIEDQELPKKCGHLPGKRVVSIGEMATKIHAAIQGKSDPDFLVVARTDARSVEGLEAAIQRDLVYVEAGADALFPEVLESAEEFHQFAQAMTHAGIKVPLIANMTEFGKTPLLINDTNSVSLAQQMAGPAFSFPWNTFEDFSRARVGDPLLRDNLFLIYYDDDRRIHRAYTYAEFGARVSHMSAFLQSRCGLTRGQRLATVLFKDRQFREPQTKTPV